MSRPRPSVSPGTTPAVAPEKRKPLACAPRARLSALGGREGARRGEGRAGERRGAAAFKGAAFERADGARTLSIVRSR
jgi:hypothetical protein